MIAYDRPTDRHATRIALRRHCWRHAGETATYPGPDAAVGWVFATDAPAPRRRHHPGADSLQRRPAANGPGAMRRPYSVTFYLMLLAGIVGAAGFVVVLLAAAAGLL